MTVTLVQMDIAWGDAKTNREAAEKAILSSEKSDLYVLPEMWNTGFDIEPEGIAECLFPQEDGEKENKGSETLLWMQRMADKLDAAVAGSIAVRLPDGSYRNRLYFVTPGTTPNLPPRKEAFRCQSPSLLGGEAEGGGWYDKHHLFTYGNEHLHYTPGNERVTVEWRGVRFRLSTCYDLRFPLRGIVAIGAHAGLARAAAGKSHREPMLCAGSEPRGQRPCLSILRRDGFRESLRRDDGLPGR